MEAIAEAAPKHQTSAGPGELRWRKAALACGAASFLLYVGFDALAAALYDGYSYADQTISELSAIGAPTRGLWLPFGAVWSLLVIALGAGVWASSGSNRALRAVAALVMSIGATGLVAWPLAPMHQREALAAGEGDWRDTMHLGLGFLNMVLFISAIALASSALGRRFRWYSIVTVAVALLFALLTGLVTPGLEDNEATPWLGLYERAMLFPLFLWLAMLGLALSQSNERDPVPTVDQQEDGHFEPAKARSQTQSVD